jgi:hypothetical protein
MDKRDTQTKKIWFVVRETKRPVNYYNASTKSDVILGVITDPHTAALLAHKNQRKYKLREIITDENYWTAEATSAIQEYEQKLAKKAQIQAEAQAALDLKAAAKKASLAEAKTKPASKKKAKKASKAPFVGFDDYAAKYGIPES